MLYQQKIPVSFSVVKRGKLTVLVKEGYQECIQHILCDTESLYKRYGDNAGMKSGRGNYISVPLKENHAERLIIKNYRHGGLFGKLFGGVFLNGDRPLIDIGINEVASQKGVPTAEVIAVTKRMFLGVFYRANFISKEISGAVDIMQFLKESPFEKIQKQKKVIIFALIKLIRKMHDIGIYHADLHLKNILIKEGENGEFDAYIIDLDKSVVSESLTLRQRMKNLQRLDRFIEKVFWLSRSSYNSSFSRKVSLISKADRIRFLKYYMTCDTVVHRDWKRFLRQYQSYYSFHKFWWRIFGIF
ncbi:MAG: hypothetical protein E3K32_03870 [wastewater metagenome]|nr:hypothetical protein [Candidatus Loosdrechtia aerotolerans]